MWRALIIAVCLFAVGERAAASKTGDADPAPTRDPRLPDCTLKGAAKSPNEPMGRVIRIFLDANDWEDCKQMVTGYCKQEILKVGFMPQGLEGEFRPPPPQVTFSAKKYRVTEKCRVVVLPPERN